MKKTVRSVTNNSIKTKLIKNKNYTNLLEIIGVSPVPISSYEINKEFTRLYKNTEDIETTDKKKNKTKWKKKHNQYIYKMIKQLRPNIVENYYTYFFNWDEIVENESQKKRVIHYIKDNFKIDLRITGDSFEEADLLPLFSKSKDDKIIKIENLFTNSIVSIEKTTGGAELIVSQNDRQRIDSLYLKNNNEIYHSKRKIDDPYNDFINTFYNKSPYFLDIVRDNTKTEKKKDLKDNQSSRNSYSYSDKNYESETIDVFEDGFMVRKPLKNYVPKWLYELRQNNSKIQYKPDKEKVEKHVEKYFLNIRGLILYILCKIENNENGIKNQNVPNQEDSSKNRKKYRKNISDVLANLSQNYPSNFPFLLYYKKFKEIQDVTKNHYLRYYEVDILITIAKELKSQIWFDEQYSNLNLNSNNDTFINYWIVKRYSSELTHYLAYFLKDLKEDNKEEFLTIFREYQNKMIINMLQYLKDEQKLAQDLLDEFNSRGLLISK